MEALDRARAIGTPRSAAPDDLDAILDRARDVAFNREVLPANVAAQVTPLPNAGLQDASTPASDGIPTAGQALPRVGDPLAGRNLVDEADTYVRRSVKSLPIVGAPLDRLATGLQSSTSGTPVAELQQRQAEADKRNPGSALAGDVTGAAALIPAVGAFPTAFGLNASTATRAALTGGTTNAVIGALDTIVREAIEKGEVNPRNVATSAAVNAAGGAVGGVVGRAVGRKVALSRATDPIETANVDEIPKIIARRAGDAYGRAETSGFNVTAAEFQGFTRQMTTELRGKGFAPNLNPNVAGALTNFDDAARAGPVTLRQMDELRQQLGGIAGNFNSPAEQRLAGIAIRQLDDFVRAQPDDGGNAAIREARRLWHVRSKATTISDAISNAELNPNNPLSAVRTAFRPLLKNNAQELRQSGFTRAEIAQVRKLYNASSLDEILQTVNRLGPGSIVTLGVGAVSFLSTGSIQAGVGSAAAMVGASRVARSVSQSRVQSAAEDVLRSLVRGSTQRPMSPVAGNLAAQFGIQGGNERRRVGR